MLRSQVVWPQLPSSFASATRSPNSILLTASFGYLIPSALLDKFLPLNTLNVHPSLLPRYRGAAPIQYTVINGDCEMGVSVQELSKGKFDRGRLLGQKALVSDFIRRTFASKANGELGRDESLLQRTLIPSLDRLPHPQPTPANPTFTSLEPVLAAEGGKLLVEVIQNLAQAQAAATEQDPAKASLAPKLHKEMARIDWTAKTAAQVLRLQAGVAHQASPQDEYLKPEVQEADVPCLHACSSRCGPSSSRSTRRTPRRRCSSSSRPRRHPLSRPPSVWRAQEPPRAR